MVDLAVLVFDGKCAGLSSDGSILNTENNHEHVDSDVRSCESPRREKKYTPFRNHVDKRAQAHFPRTPLEGASVAARLRTLDK